MLSTLLAATLVVLLAVPAGAQSGAAATSAKDHEAVKQELIALDKQFDEARRTGNTALVRDLLTDDFLRISGTAAVETKEDVLKGITPAPRDQPPAQESAVPQTYTVHLHGDTAVMAHGHVHTADDVSPSHAATHVWVKQQGRWRMAAWTNTMGELTTEQKLNTAGYELMEDGKLAQAIELFKMNVRLHPQAWNTYDSLGEAYAKSGETALAIENYEKSLQLNPKNEAGKAALAKLKNK